MQSSLRRRGARSSMLGLFMSISASAAGFAWLWSVDVLQLVPGADPEAGSFERFHSGVLPALALIADPFLATWTLAWLACRLWGPRPRWRRLARRPGATVGFVAGLAWLVGGGVMLRWAADEHHRAPTWVEYGYVHLASATMLGGFGVLAAWSGSALSGGWRPEGSWIDRMGRALGVGWIALGIPSADLLEALTGPFY